MIDFATAVAIIWPQEGLYKGRERARPHTFWRITWRGPCGSSAADTAYSSREKAEAMAKLCGAREITFAEAKP